MKRILMGIELFLISVAFVYFSWPYSSLTVAQHVAMYGVYILVLWFDVHYYLKNRRKFSDAVLKKWAVASAYAFVIGVLVILVKG